MTTIPLDYAGAGERANERTRRAQQASTVLRYFLLTAVGLVMLYPLIWLVGASFKSNAEIFASPGFWPRNPTLDGYIKGWQTSTAYTFATLLLEHLPDRAPEGDRHGDLLHRRRLRLRPLRLPGQEDPVRAR